MKPLKENQNRIREILTQLKMNREKDSKQLCYQNSLVGITLKIKNYKTRTYVKNHQDQQRTLQNELRSQINTKMKCKRQKKCTGLEISKATLHIAQGKGRTDRTHLIQNKQNSSQESLKEQKRRKKYKSIFSNRSNQMLENRTSLKKQSIRVITSKTQYYVQPRFCVDKSTSMHMRFRTDYQLLRPDIEGWKTQYDEIDMPNQF